MRVKRLLQQGLIAVALVSAASLLSIVPAQATAYDYTVTGTITGTFNADFSLVGSSFNTWSLTTPTATFTQSTGTVFTNNLFFLNEKVGTNVLSFNVLPLLSNGNYYGAYSWQGTNGLTFFSGTFARANVPEPSSILLLGIAMVGLAVWYRKRLA